MPSLELLQFDLTEECPLSCGHCSNSSGPSRTTRFPLEKLVEFLEQAAAMGVKTVVFSGGEPLCYPGLATALKTARSLDLPVTMFTTGIRDKRYRGPIDLQEWEGLRKAGLVTAAFSLYAAPMGREYHNRIVRLKPVDGDAFTVNEMAMRTARAAGIDVQAHFIPSNPSVARLQDIYDWAAGLNCSALHLQLPTRQGRNETLAFLGLGRSQEQLLQLAVSALVTISTTAFYVSRLWRQRWSGSSSNCGANDRQLIIRADGSISPCNACKYLTPTAHQESILEPPKKLIAVWENSATLQAYRSAKAMNSVCPRCHGIFAEIKQEEAFGGSALLPVVPADEVFS
ncbi:MAG: radical SAM protein [Terriglobia bacterium]